METGTTALVSTISLGFLCYIFFWLFRATEIDRFRHEMFALRDTLFDEAANGLVSFDHPAYGNLRLTMNGYIRFAHRLSVWHILYIVFLTKGHGLEEFARRKDSWERVTKGLDEVQLKRLNEFRNQMDAVVISHFLKLFPECIFVWLALLGLVGATLLLAGILFLSVRSVKLAVEITEQRVRRRIALSYEGLNAMALIQGS